MNLRSLASLFLVFALSAIPAFGQSNADQDTGDTASQSASATGEDGAESAGGGLGFGFDLGLGVQTFEDPTTGEPETYQQLSLRPDIAVGKFGIGLNVQMHYRFVAGEDGTELDLRREDWAPTEEALDEGAFGAVMGLYLPKIAYVRWAQKGDPLFIKFGSIEDSTLGNGFIMGNYSNSRFLPDRRILGLNVDVDGRLFDFPLLGVETVVGNVSAWDVFGARLYGRPLLPMDIPVIKNLEVGTSFVRDGDPFYHAQRDPSFEPSSFGYDGDEMEEAGVSVFGVDYQLPLISSEVFTLANFADFVVQQGSSGGMLGFGGTAFGIMPYGAQLRILGEDFIPVYFDSTYDLSRVERYDVYDHEGDPLIDRHVGYFASTGFSVLDGQIVFTASIDGPIGETAGSEPQLKAGLTVAEGLLPGLSGQASYTKSDISGWDSFTSLENSVIDSRINYQTGPAVISLVYNLRYDPFDPAQEDPWVVTSGLETSISLF